MQQGCVIPFPSSGVSFSDPQNQPLSCGVATREIWRIRQEIAALANETDGDLLLTTTRTGTGT